MGRDLDQLGRGGDSPFFKSSPEVSGVGIDAGAMADLRAARLLDDGVGTIVGDAFLGGLGGGDVGKGILYWTATMPRAKFEEQRGGAVTEYYWGRSAERVRERKVCSR